MTKLHKHLIVQAKITNPPKQADCEKVCVWLENLVHKINMEVLRKASAEYCDDIGNRGMTADVLLKTSHMILHTWDEETVPYIEYDLYTCSHLDIEPVFEELRSMFGAYDIRYKFLDRYEGLVIIQEN